MALVTKFGKPDLFITMTCNPSWSEITDSLLPGQTYSDRPDIVARVFHLKLQELLRLLTKEHVCGQVIAYSLAIEFQKRGLPHSHILLILRREDKMFDARRIDNLISAEIPDRDLNPKLHDLVSRFMIHGPHSPTSSCMTKRSGKRVIANQCSKQFPKPFQDSTLIVNDGYPLYKRPNNNRTVTKNSAIARGETVELGNESVVPYCKKLLLMFECHINVEVCTNISSVKYIYKYTYKGHDVAQLNIEEARPLQSTASRPAEADRIAHDVHQEAQDIGRIEEYDEISRHSSKIAFLFSLNLNLSISFNAINRHALREFC